MLDTRRFLALALALPVGAAAQTALTPGHPDLTAAPPQRFDYETRVAADEPGGAPRNAGWWTYSETVGPAPGQAGRGQMVIVQRRSDRRAGTRLPDTTVVAWPGLAPVSRVARGGATERGATERVAFASGRVRGRVVTGNLDEPVDAAVPEGVFGEGVALRIVRSVPLRAGYTATFQTADAHGVVSTDTLRVVGETQAPRADGTQAAAWTGTLARAGEPRHTYLVDAVTRGLLQVAYSFRAGATMETAPPRPTPAGPVLRPGDAALDTRWLRDETATYTVRLVEPDRRDVGLMTVVRTLAGGGVTETATLVLPQQGATVTTATAAAATLSPQTHVATGGPDAATLAFTASGVSGTAAGAPVADVLRAPVFDAAWMATVAQSLPFEPGYTATAETYSAKQGVRPVTFRVSGPAREDGRTVWTVDAATPDGPFTYAVDAATRALVRTRFSPQPGVVVEMARQP